MSLVARDLANEMASQLDEAWAEVKGEPFPGGSRDDSRVMFLAIARGLLIYLESHKTDMVRTIRLDGGDARTVNSVDLNTEFDT